MTESRATEGAAARGSVAWALLNLRSAFAWKCADAADAALRFAQRLEPDIDIAAESRRRERAPKATADEDRPQLSSV